VSVLESKIAMRERGKAGGNTGGKNHPKIVSLEDTATPKLTVPRKDTRARLSKRRHHPARVRVE